MKKIGFLLVAVGFIAGALVTVVDKTEVRWGLFLPAFVTGIIGVFMIHYQERKHARSETKISTNLQDITTSLTNVVEKLIKLNAEKQSMDPHEFHIHIDRLFRDDLTTFAEARESLAHAHNLQVYADVMSHFASGERYINRVWSASADGYVDECITYLDRAQVQFSEALQIVSGLNSST